MEYLDPQPPETEFWYRARQVFTAGGYGYPSMTITFDRYRVIRHTPAGVIIDDWSEKGRFVKRRGNKVFCRSNKRDALADYTHRKRRQIPIVSSQLKWAKRGKAIADEWLEQNPDAEPDDRNPLMYKETAFDSIKTTTSAE